MSNTIVPISDPLMYQGQGPVDFKNTPVNTVSELPNSLKAYDGLEVVVKQDPETGSYAKYWFKNGSWEKEVTGSNSGITELSAITESIESGLTELSASTVDIESGLSELSAYTETISNGSLELVDHTVANGGSWRHYWYIPEIDMSKYTSFTIDGLPVTTIKYYEYESRVLFVYDDYEDLNDGQYEGQNLLPKAIVVYNYSPHTKKATYRTNYRPINGGIPRKIVELLGGNPMSRKWQTTEKKRRKNGDKKMDIVPSYSTMQRPYVYIGQSVLISRNTRFAFDDNNTHVHEGDAYFYLEKYKEIDYNSYNKELTIRVSRPEFMANAQGHFLIKYNSGYMSLKTTDGDCSNYRVISKDDFIENGDECYYKMTLQEDITVGKLHVFMPVENDFFMGNVILNKTKNVTTNISYVKKEDQQNNRWDGDWQTKYNLDVQVLKRCNPNEFVLVARNRMMINPMSNDWDGSNTIDPYGYYSTDYAPMGRPDTKFRASGRITFEELVNLSENQDYEVLYYVAGGRRGSNGGYRWRRLTHNRFWNVREIDNNARLELEKKAIFKQYLSQIISGQRSSRLGAISRVHHRRYIYVAIFKVSNRPSRGQSGRGRHPFKVGDLYEISYQATFDMMHENRSTTELIWKVVDHSETEGIISLKRKGYIDYPNKLR